MKKNYTHIEVILDKSGSMAPTISDTLGGLNNFVEAQKKVPGTCSYQLVQFDSTVELGTHYGNISDVPVLTAATYTPRGNTALLDAIGVTVSTLGSRLAAAPEEERPSKVIVVIITDGEENKSTEFKHDDINKMINHQRDSYKWEFVFLGANQDAIKVGTSLGVLKGAAMTYASGKGFVTAGQHTNNMVTASRIGGSSSSLGLKLNSYTDSMRKEAVDARPKAQAADPFKIKETNSQGEKV